MIVLQLFLVLGMLVLVHELGHFAMAKWCGVRVDAFAIGFGRRIAGYRFKGTNYRINLLPLGGYVKMRGEIPGKHRTDDTGDLNNHPRWQRILIALAGPIANLVLAFFLMTGASLLHDPVNQYASGPAATDYISSTTAAYKTGIRSGDTIVRFDTIENPTWVDIFERASLDVNRTVPFSFVHDGTRVDTTFLVDFPGDSSTFSVQSALQLGLVPQMQDTPLQVAALTPGGPAAKAGLKPDDRVLTVNGIVIRSIPALNWYLHDQKGKPATLELLRDGRHISLSITPQKGISGGSTSTGYELGFTALVPPVRLQHMSVADALAASWTFCNKNSLLVISIFKGIFQQRVSVENLSGPIGIGRVVRHAASAPGWMPLIAAMATISINLGIFNLLPFPVLDGGMISLLLIESSFRRDLPVQVRRHVYQAAFVCILLFAVVVICNDITRLPFFSHLRS